MIQLPTVLITHILEFSDFENLLSIMRVNKEWKNITNTKNIKFAICLKIISTIVFDAKNRANNLMNIYDSITNSIFFYKDAFNKENVYISTKFSQWYDKPAAVDFFDKPAAVLEISLKSIKSQKSHRGEMVYHKIKVEKFNIEDQSEKSVVNRAVLIINKYLDPIMMMKEDQIKNA